MANKQYLIELAVKDDKLKSSLKKALESSDIQKQLGILGEGITEHLEKDVDKAASILGKVDWASLLGTEDFKHLQQLVANTVRANKNLIKSFVQTGDLKGIQDAVELVSVLGSELKAINPDMTVAGLARSMASFIKTITPLTDKLNEVSGGAQNFQNIMNNFDTSTINKKIQEVSRSAQKMLDSMGSDAAKDAYLARIQQTEMWIEKLEEVMLDKKGLNAYLAGFSTAKDIAEEMSTIMTKLKDINPLARPKQLVLFLQQLEGLQGKLTPMLPELNTSGVKRETKTVVHEIEGTLEKIEDKLEKSFNTVIERKLGTIKVKIAVPTEEQLVADINKVVEAVNKKSTSTFKLVGAESAIKEAQKKILDDTQAWHNKMKDALKFSKKEDIELDLGVKLKDIGSNVGADLRRSIEEYFDNPANKVAVPVELILTGENKAILEGGGNITINGGVGGGEITAESLAKALNTPIEVKVQEEQQKQKPSGKHVNIKLGSAFSNEVLEVFDQIFDAIERGGENAKNISEFFTLKGLNLSELKSKGQMDILSAFESFLERGDQSVLDEVETRLAKGSTKNKATLAFADLLRDSIFRFNLDNITTQEDVKRRQVRALVENDYIPQSETRDQIFALMSTQDKSYQLPTVEELAKLMSDLPERFGVIGEQFVPAIEALKELRSEINDPTHATEIQRFKKKVNELVQEGALPFDEIHKNYLKNYSIGVFYKGHNKHQAGYDKQYQGGVGSGRKILERLDQIDYFELYDDPSGHFSRGNRKDALDNASSLDRYQLRRDSRNAPYRTDPPKKTSVVAEDVVIPKFEPQKRVDDETREINDYKKAAELRMKAIEAARIASAEEKKVAKKLRKQKLKTEHEVDATLDANTRPTRTPTVLQQLSQLPEETIQRMRSEIEVLDDSIENAKNESKALQNFVDKHFKIKKPKINYTKAEENRKAQHQKQIQRFKTLNDSLSGQTDQANTKSLTNKEAQVVTSLLRNRKMVQLLQSDNPQLDSSLERVAQQRVANYAKGLNRIDEFILKNQISIQKTRQDINLAEFLKDGDVKKVLRGSFNGSKEEETVIRAKIDEFKTRMTEAGKSYIVDYLDLWSDRNLDDLMSQHSFRTTTEAKASTLIQEFYRKIAEEGFARRDSAWKEFQDEIAKYKKNIEKDEGALKKLIDSAKVQVDTSGSKVSVDENNIKEKYRQYINQWLQTIQTNMTDIASDEISNEEKALKLKENDELRRAISEMAQDFSTKFHEDLLTESQSILLKNSGLSYNGFVNSKETSLISERANKQTEMDTMIKQRSELLKQRRFDLLKKISSRVGKGEDTTSLEKMLSEVENELIKYSDEIPYILRDKFEADLLNVKNATEEEWKQFRDNALKRRNEFDSVKYAELKEKQTSLLGEIAQKSKDGQSIGGLEEQLKAINKEIVQYEVNTSRLKDVEFAKFPNDASVYAIRIYNSEMEKLVQFQQQRALLKAKGERTVVVDRDIAKQQQKLQNRVNSQIRDDKKVVARYAPANQAAEYIQATDRALYVLQEQVEKAEDNLETERNKLAIMQGDEYKTSEIYRDRIESLKNQEVAEYVRSDEYRTRRNKGLDQANKEFSAYLSQQLGEDVAKQIVYEFNTNDDRANIDEMLTGAGNTTRLVEDAFGSAYVKEHMTYTSSEAYQKIVAEAKKNREEQIDAQLASDKQIKDAKIQEIWNQTKADIATLRSADMANSKELRDAVYAEAEKAGMADSSEYRRSIVDQVREDLIRQRIDAGRQEQKLYNQQYYEKARELRSQLSPDMYKKLDEQADQAVYNAVMSKIQGLIGDNADLLKGLEAKRNEILKANVGGIVDQYRDSLAMSETGMYKGTNVREMIEKELANTVAYYEQKYIESSGKLGVLKNERARAESFGKLGYDETLNPEIAQVRAEAEARLSTEKEKQVALTERLTNLTAQNADQKIVQSVAAELQKTEKEITRLQLLAEGASEALSLRKTAREEEFEENKWTPEKQRLWYIDAIEREKKKLDSGTDKQKTEAANHIAKWEQKLADIEKVIETAKPEAERPKTVLDMITNAIRQGLAGVTAGGTVDLDASLYNIATETTLQEILRLLGGNGAVEYANQLKAELAKDRPRYERRTSEGGNTSGGRSGGKKTRVNNDLDKLNADGQRIYGELEAEAKLFTDKLKEKGKQYATDFDFVKAIKDQAAVVKKQTKGSLEYIQEQTKLTALYQDYYHKTFGNGRMKKGQPGQSKWAEQGELGKIDGLKDLLLFKSKRADALVGLNYGANGVAQPAEIAPANKRKKNKQTVKTTNDNETKSSNEQVVAEQTAKAIEQAVANGLKIDADDANELAEMVKVAVAAAMGEGLGRDKEVKGKKVYSEYSDTISVGYDRIQKLQKIRESGTTGSTSTGVLLRANHTVWDKVKENNFFNDIPEDGLQRFSKIDEIISTTVNEILKTLGVTEQQLIQQLQEVRNATGGNFKSNGYDSGWNHFATYNESGKKHRMQKDNGVTYKVYAAFENIEDLNADIVSSIMKELSDAGFKGRLKTTSGSTSMADKLNAIVNTDQLVVHGASKKDQEIAYNVLKKMGLGLSYLSGGIDTPDGSFTQTLASDSIDKYVNIKRKEIPVEPEIQSGAVAEEVKENVKQTPPIAEVKPEIKPDAVAEEVKENTKQTKSTTKTSSKTTSNKVDNTRTVELNDKLPYDVDPNSLIGRLRNTVGGDTGALAKQATLALVLSELQAINKKVPTIGKAGVKSSAQNLLEEFQKMATGSAMDSKERVSYFDLVNGAMSPSLSGATHSVSQKLLDTLSQQYGVDKGYRSQVHTHADSAQTWFSAKDLDHFKKNLGDFGADSIKQQVLLTKDNITVFDMTMVETAEKAALAIDILKKAGSNIDNETLEQLTNLGARYQSKDLGTISAKGLMDLLGVKNYKDDGKKQGAVADPEVARADLEAEAKSEADKRNSKYVFNSFDGEILKYQLVDSEGHISKVILAWDELEKKVRVVSDTSTSSVDATVKKIQQYKTEIQNAKKELLLSKGDDAGFIAAEKVVDNLVKKIESGSLSGEALSDAINKLEVARTNLANEGAKLHKLIAQNNKLRGGTAEVRQAVTQGTRVRSLVGGAIGTDDNNENLLKLEDQEYQFLQKYIDAYNNLILKQQEYINNGSINSAKVQDDLKVQTAGVKKLGTEAMAAYKNTQRLQEASAQSESQTYQTPKGKEYNLGGSKQINPSEVNREAMLQYAKEVLGADLASVKFNATTGKLTGVLKKNNYVVSDMAVEYDKATGKLHLYQEKERESLSGMPGFLNGLKAKSKAIIQYVASMTSIYRVLGELRKGIQYIREIDLALTELKKVTNETEETYDEFLQTAAKTGARLGSTISAVTEATATFAKLGYNMKQASEMAEAAIVYKNVGDNIASTEDAANSIISTLKGFRMEASASMAIVDKFNEVGNNFAITSQGIGEALRLSASALSEGGNSLDESIAMITAANEVVNDPSSVGTALKTLTLRLRGSKTELEEMGEDVSDMATTTSQLQAKLLALTGGKVDIMLDANTFKSSTQILREMADAWEDMSDIQRANALELMGGKRQANVLSALIQNFDTVEKVIETSQNSAGSALRENERYLDSIQGKIDQFNNAVQAMWNNTLDSDTVKNIVEIGTWLVKAIDKIGLFNAALAGLAGYSMLKHKMGPIAFFKGIIEAGTKGLQSLGSYAQGLKNVSFKTEELQHVTTTLTQTQLKEKLVSTGLTDSAAEQIVVQTNLGKATDELSAKTLDATLREAGYSKAKREAILQTVFNTQATEENANAETENATATQEAGAAKDEESVDLQENLNKTEQNSQTKNRNTLEEQQNKQATNEAGAAKDNQSQDFAENTAQIQNNTKELQLNNQKTKESAQSSVTLGTKLKNLGTSLKTFAKDNAGMLLMVATTILTVVQTKIIDAIVKTMDEVQEEFDEAVNELESLNAELDNLESQLKDVNSQIEELQENSPLSFTDKEELSRLKAHSAELQRQIDLTETLKQQQEYKVNNQAIEAADKYRNVGVKTGKTTGQNVGDTAKTVGGIGLGVTGAVGSTLLAIGATNAWNVIGWVALAAAAVTALASGVAYAVSETEGKVGDSIDNMREQYTKLQDEYNTARANYNQKASKKNQKKLEKAEEAFNTYRSNMAGYMTEMNSYYQQIRANWETATDAQKKEYTEWADSMDTWAIQDGGVNAKSNALNRIFGDEAEGGFAKARDEINRLKKNLIEARKSGEGVDEALAALKSFELKLSSEEVARLREMGIYLYEAEDYFKDVTKAESEFIDLGLHEVAKDINKITDGLAGLKSAFDEVIERGSVTAQTLMTLYEDFEGFNKTEDGQKAWRDYTNVMFSGVASIEEMTVATEKYAQEVLDYLLAEGALTTETKWTYIVQLQNLGVDNAQEYVEDKLQTKLVNEIEDNVNINAYLDHRYQSSDEAIKQVEELAKKYNVEKTAIEEIIERLKEKQAIEKQIDDARKKKNDYDEWYGGKDGQPGYMALKEQNGDFNPNDWKRTRRGDSYGYTNTKTNEFLWHNFYESRKEIYDKLQALTTEGNEKGYIINDKIVDPDYQTEINNLQIDLNNVIDEIEEDATINIQLKLELQNKSELVDDIQNVFDTLKNAVTEFNENGYLTVDTVQGLLSDEIDSKYLTLLQDENGQLQLNEQSLLELAKARMMDLGIKKATNLIDTMENALNADQIEKAKELTTVTYGLTESTWDLVESEAARVATLMAKKGMTANEIASFTQQIQAIINLTDNAVNNLPNTFSSSGNTVKQEAEDEFQKLMDHYDNRISANQAKYDQIQNDIDWLESQGKMADASYYRDQIDLMTEGENSKEQLLTNKLNAAKDRLDELKNANKEGSDEWWEAAKVYNDTLSELDDVRDTVISLQDAIADVEWSAFEEFNTRLDDINSKLETMRNLIAPDGEEDWFDDEGNWTSKGVAVLGSQIQSLEYYKNGLDKATEKLNTFKSVGSYEGHEEWFADNYGIHSEQEYYDYLKKLTDEQYNYAQSVSDTEQDIAGMWESQIDAVEEYTSELIDSYNDYIDVTKEALDAERELYDFKKNVAKQTKDIASLERRIAALSGSTNASDIAERRKLEAELYESREALNDTYYEHSMDSQQQALDDEAAAYEEAMNKFVENLRDNLDLALQDMEGFIAGVTAAVTANAPLILDEYDKLGISLDSAIVDPWQEAKDAIGDYTTEDGLGLMNSWTASGGVFDTFATDASNYLTSIWSDTNIDPDNAFENAIVGKVNGITESIRQNVETAQGYINDLYDVKDNSVMAPSGDGDSSGDGKETVGYNFNSKALQEILNDVFGANLTVDGKFGSKSQAALKKAQGQIQSFLGARGYRDLLTVNGKFDEKTRQNMLTYFDIMAGIAKSNDHPEASDTYLKAKKKLPVSFTFAKGTLGTKQSGFAITDESWIGEEITLAAGKNGQLQYLKKGSAVMPADISANLVEWGKLNPNMMNVGASPNINMISNAINKPELNLTFDALVKAENITEETLPAVKKLVTQELNRFTKELNYALKGKGAR